jgi:hypothetical protein
MPCLANPLSEDPNAMNGMMTKVWGPAGWLFLHCVTFGYPLQPDEYDKQHGMPPGSTRRHYGQFFNEVGRVLPCRYCRESYLEYIEQLPVEKFLYDRQSLIKWLFLIHNKVNEKLGAKYCNLSLAKVHEKYEAYRAKCKAPSASDKKKNEEKGCLTPADGTPKRCLIEVVKTDKGDITRRDNSTLFGPVASENENPITGKRKSVNYLLILFMFVFLLASFGLGMYVGKYHIKPSS